MIPDEDELDPQDPHPLPQPTFGVEEEVDDLALLAASLEEEAAANPPTDSSQQPVTEDIVPNSPVAALHAPASFSSSSSSSASASSSSSSSASSSSTQPQSLDETERLTPNERALEAAAAERFVLFYLRSL